MGWKGRRREKVCRRENTARMGLSSAISRSRAWDFSSTTGSCPPMRPAFRASGRWRCEMRICSWEWIWFHLAAGHVLYDVARKTTELDGDRRIPTTASLRLLEAAGDSDPIMSDSGTQRHSLGDRTRGERREHDGIETVFCLRRIPAAPAGVRDDPQPKAIAASMTEDKIYLLEENDSRPAGPRPEPGGDKIGRRGAAGLGMEGRVREMDCRAQGFLARGWQASRIRRERGHTGKSEDQSCCRIRFSRTSE